VGHPKVAGQSEQDQGESGQMRCITRRKWGKLAHGLSSDSVKRMHKEEMRVRVGVPRSWVGGGLSWPDNPELQAWR